MLYTLINNFNAYLILSFDGEQLRRIIKNYSADVDTRVDFSNMPRSYKDIINEPLQFSFPPDKDCQLPDLNLHLGRLFLNKKSYDVLYPLLKNDGEFLPATYEKGEAYFFIPFRVAEDVEAINKALSVENTWNYFDHLVFYEDKIKDWSIFRTKHGGFMNIYCQESVKDVIIKNGLTGLFITADLANIFPEERSAVEKAN